MSDRPTKILENGSKLWLNSEGRQHREGDLPAAIWADGTYEWIKNGAPHRDNDLPAIISPNRHCIWLSGGKIIKAKYCTKAQIEEFKKPYGGK